MPGFHAGQPPRNKGLRYPADRPTIAEIVAVLRIAADGLHGRQLRGLIVALWRAGLRIDEALALREADLDRRRGSILVHRGTGGRRREIGIDGWGWQDSDRGFIARVALPIGPLFCVINGRTRGRPWTTSGARAEPRCAARQGHVVHGAQADLPGLHLRVALRATGRARASVPTPAGRAPAHSSADAAQRQSQSSSHANAEAHRHPQVPPT